MDEPGAAPRKPCDVPDGIIRRPAVAFDDRKSSSGSAIGATGADGIDGGADGGAVDEAPSSRAVALLKSNFSLTTPILASSACSFSAADCRSSASASSSEMREALPSRSAVRSSICLLAAASCSAASDVFENSLRSRLNLVLDRQITRASGIAESGFSASPSDLANACMGATSCFWSSGASSYASLTKLSTSACMPLRAMRCRSLCADKPAFAEASRLVMSSSLAFRSFT